MSHQDRPIQPAYRVGNETKSILDLLRRFADPDYQSHGVSRLSDLHLKVGEPARYRFDDDLIPSKRSLISQRELGRHVPSFTAGLRSALREDPDIILVGEMRDQETCSLALSAAETGHLVLSTLHTKDARGAITRIVDLFPADRGKELLTQLSFSLSVILGQKLIPRADGTGRRMVMEVLSNLPPTANQIRSGNLHQIYSTMQTLRKGGLNTLEDHLIELVRNGSVKKEDALRVANEPRSMAALA